MNLKQKFCLWFGIVTIVIMGIFPPWVSTYHLENRPPSERILCYAHISNVPVPSGSRLEGVRLNSLYLFIQWTMVAAVTCGLILTFSEKGKN